MSRDTKRQVLERIVGPRSQNSIARELGIHKSTVAYHVKTLREDKAIVGPGPLLYKPGPNFNAYRTKLQTPPRVGSEETYWHNLQLKCRINKLPKTERLRWKGGRSKVFDVEHYYTKIRLNIDGEDMDIGIQKSLSARKQTMILRLHPQTLLGDDTKAHLQYFENIAWVVRKFLSNKCGYALGILEWCKTPDAEWLAEDLEGVVDSYVKVDDELYFDMTGPTAKRKGVPMEGSRSLDYIADRQRIVPDMRDTKERLTRLEEFDRATYESLTGIETILESVVVNQETQGKTLRAIESILKRILPESVVDPSSPMFQ